MTPCFDRLKITALAVMIGIGALLHGQAAQAADMRTAIFAGGCFWCVESDFEGVKGVSAAESGFIGGNVANPTYKQVTKGGTGHYEAVKITYDADVVSYGRLLNLFFRSIDPTDPGGQFCDRGATYRTAVFYSSDKERKDARRAKSTAQQALGQKVVTEVLPAGTFYPADAYHQDYYKSSDRVLTRFGLIKKKDAYKRYRMGCKRDQRVRELWGSSAPFVGG